MKRALALATLMMTVSGCFGAGSDPVDEPTICAETAEETTAHAAALAEDGGPRSVSTGRELIAELDAGCGRS